MKYSTPFYISVLLGIALMPSCLQKQSRLKQVGLICVRDLDTLHIRLSNNTDDTVYIPSSFTGTYNVDNDTVFLEVIDKLRFNTDYYYGYFKSFPFKIYTARKLAGQTPDTIIKVVNQTYYFNQFLTRPFITLYPDSTYIQSITFDVPKRANILQVVYYYKSFNSWLGRDSNYLLEDFIRFDSLNAKYVSTYIVNRFFIE